MPARMSLPIELRVRCAGRDAMAALAGGGPAVVFAAFERSCYVETPTGIACIGSPAIGRGPLNATVEGDFIVPDPGTALTIDCRAARGWEPPVLRLHPARVARAIRRARSAWAALRPDDGLAALVDAPEGMGSSARRAAGSLLDWLGREARGRAPAGATALIGFGPGLTPSGDDFLAGALLALHALGRQAVQQRLARWVTRAAGKRTSRISRAHLRCAAGGRGHERLHEFLAALGAEASDPVTAMRALDRLGHTSGWDAAAGVLLTLERLAAVRGTRCAAATSSRSLEASRPG